MSGPRAKKIAYGSDPAQFGELTMPTGTPRGVAIVIHGGFWHEQYDLSLGRPMSADLATGGWVAWNLEYRRIENGGGWPTTFDDIAAGIDKLADIPDVPMATVVTIGHSAGGHLAVWAGARATPLVPITAAISQAGVLDFDAAIREHLGGDAVLALMGDAGDLGDVDPIRQIPLKVPVWCIHGDQDDTVPISQSVDYVAAARAAGGTAELLQVPGDHYALIDPSTDAWTKTITILDGI